MTGVATPEQVVAEARSWVGTPFYPHMAVKGVGADCVHMALAVYQATGLLPSWLVLPKYSLDQGDHLASSMVVQWLSQSPHFEPVCCKPLPGYLVTMNFGRVTHHVAVVTGESSFVQAIRRAGRGSVVERTLKDPTWCEAVTGCWRPKGMTCSDLATT